MSVRASRTWPGQREFLERHVPEMKVTVAHGQMPSTVLDDIMSAFYDGKYDLLLSTTIVESGLDIPNANTLIVHRADRFGLSQLYQLRGRVGRSKVRAYSLFTLPAERKITVQAEQRLKVLQSLDTLGAGFQLASHDLDLRGAGNLLGEEQSGHIKEVGFELYQQMLEEAVASLKAGITAPVADKWSPQITIGTPVMIPEDYVADLPVRLALYRRLGEIEDEREIEAFGAEMADRFGPLPIEVEHLLQIVAIKALCRQANVEKIEAGPKGAVVTFRDNTFANPERLIKFIRDEGARVRPDQKVVFIDDWEQAEDRLRGTRQILRKLVELRSRRRRRDPCAAQLSAGSDCPAIPDRMPLRHNHLRTLISISCSGSPNSSTAMLVERRHVLERREIGVDHLARHADVAHLRPRPEDEDVHDVLERGAGGVERRLDAVHRAAGLRFEARRHVFQDVFAPVRMVVIDRQRGGAGEPEDLSALDLDAGHERHEEGLVVVRVVDDLHVLVRLSLRRAQSSGETCDSESSERRARSLH